jgi:tRNA(Ile)-lysidine synthase
MSTLIDIGLLKSQWAISYLPRCTFADNAGPLNLAVSGGADSVAMLLLAVSAGEQVVVWHVDHGLRDESVADALFVESLCNRLGAVCHVVRVAIDDGPNLEARARTVRHQALPPDCAYAHTADDQLETFLINLMRGSGLDGWVALRGGPSHPVLALRRAETHAICADVGLSPIVDSMNDDDRFLRVRVRHELLPLIDDIAQRDVAAVFSRQANFIADDVDYLNTLAADLDPTDTRALQIAPLPLARRAVRQWLRSDDGYMPDALAIQRVMEVVNHQTKATEVSGVGRVTRHDGKLSIQPVTPS